MTDWTAVYLKVPEGYAAFVAKLPGANAQGPSLEEARESLQEAIELTLEATRTGSRHSLFVNRAKGKSSTVLRHSEVNGFTARAICRDLACCGRHVSS